MLKVEEVDFLVSKLLLQILTVRGYFNFSTAIQGRLL